MPSSFSRTPNKKAGGLLGRGRCSVESEKGWRGSSGKVRQERCTVRRSKTRALQGKGRVSRCSPSTVVTIVVMIGAATTRVNGCGTGCAPSPSTCW